MVMMERKTFPKSSPLEFSGRKIYSCKWKCLLMKGESYVGIERQLKKSLPFTHTAVPNILSGHDRVIDLCLTEPIKTSVKDSDGMR